MKSITPEELTEQNGIPGTRTLIAVDGTVYDVSESKKWTRGLHMNRHHAGIDLTDALSAAPHGRDVLERFPVVGALSRPTGSDYQGTRAVVEAFLVRHPFFRRHPHPAIVHIPIGLLMTAPVLLFLSLATASARTEWAAVCCTIAGVVSIPAAIVTGYFSWWVNYECRESRIILAKRRLAWSSLIVGALTVGLRAFTHDPLMLEEFRAILYVVALTGLSLIVGVLGFLGGKLTFPYEERTATGPCRDDRSAGGDTTG
ncbi:MAG: DUF2231 domain-containing protein [Thermodesulfobacteriota bacterium]